jgi:hypothetical protein
LKTDRFSAKPIRAAAILLSTLLLAPDLYAQRGIRLWRLNINFDSPSKKWADALAPQVQEVQNRFDASRRALRPLQDPGGKPAYQRKDVADLIAHTGKDLDDAIVKVQPSGLQPLRDWAAEEVARIQAELGALPGPKTAAFHSGRSTPRAIARAANPGKPPKPASPKPAAPPQDTVPAEKSNSLLDELGKVVSQIFTLASHDDLEVKLWAGSTETNTTLSFWPMGQIKGAAPSPFTIQTNGTRDHVIRGLYSYKAVWQALGQGKLKRGQGAAEWIIQYPNPANTPSASIPSERLDLVKGSPFFCCQFQEGYCHHVDNEKQCRR